MKKLFLKKLKEATSYSLVLLMIALNLAFAPNAQAVGETLTISSQPALNGELINVPLNTSSFSDVGSITLYIDFDSSLLSYQDFTLDQLPLSTITQTGNRITIVWFDATGFNPISFNTGDKLLYLNFNVISSDSINTDIIISPSSIIGNSQAQQIDVDFVNGTITLNPDEIAPVLSEVTPVPTPTNDNTPDYTFNSDEAGTINYGGGCTSATTDAVAGDNTITFNNLAEGTYDSCSLTVTDFDFSANESDLLSISVFIIDNTAPIIILIGDAVVNLIVEQDDYNEAGATALDDVDGVIAPVVIGGDVVDTGMIGIYIVTYNISDSVGNPANEVTRTVNIVDTEAPGITLLGDDPVTIEVGSTYSDDGVTAADNYDGDITSSIVTVNPVDENTVGQYTVTYNVTDSSSNPAVEVTRTVNVVDTTAPIITLSGSDSVTIEVGSTYNDAGATASDNYDGNITGSIIAVNSVNKNILGVYTITYNVTDSNDNPATEVTRIVNVVDSIAPVITLLGNNPVTIPIGTAYNDAGATASDNYNGDVSMNIVTVNPVNINAIGTYKITYNVSDSSGNPAVEVTRTVNIVDVSTPIITLSGDNPVTIEVGSVYNDAGATATDDVDGDLTDSIIVVNNVDPNTVDSYTVTYNVSDSSGNPAPEVVRTVNVVDTIPPVITLLGDNLVNVEVGYEYNDAGATANDNYNGDITGSIVTAGNVDTNTVGIYSVTYNVTDSNGNLANEVVRTVNVTPDVTPPVITLNGGDMNIYQDTSFTDPGATASDNLDGDISGDIVVTGDTVDTNTVGTYIITYNVSDGVGNLAPEASRTVTVLPVVVIPVPTPSSGGGGGGGFVSHCSNIVYGEWGTCINDMQYRDVISQNPKYCNLSTSQQLARSKKCSEVVPVPAVSEEEVVEPVEPAEEPEQEVLGERKYTDGTLLRGSDMKIYVVVGGTLKHILSLEELMKYAGQEILNVEDEELNSLEKGEVLGAKKYADGTLLRSSDMKIYVIVGGEKKHILNLEELMKYAGQEILDIDDEVISEIENA